MCHYTVRLLRSQHRPRGRNVLTIKDFEQYIAYVNVGSNGRSTNLFRFDQPGFAILGECFKVAGLDCWFLPGLWWMNVNRAVGPSLKSLLQDA